MASTVLSSRHVAKHATATVPTRRVTALRGGRRNHDVKALLAAPSRGRLDRGAMASLREASLRWSLAGPVSRIGTGGVWIAAPPHTIQGRTAAHHIQVGQLFHNDPAPAPASSLQPSVLSVPKQKGDALCASPPTTVLPPAVTPCAASDVTVQGTVSATAGDTRIEGHATPLRAVGTSNSCTRPRGLDTSSSSRTTLSTNAGIITMVTTTSMVVGAETPIGGVGMTATPPLKANLRRGSVHLTLRTQVTVGNMKAGSTCKHL